MESPLLRLPAELRQKIWQFATAGNIINLHGDHTSSDNMICQGHTVGVVGKDNPIRWISTRAEDKPRLPAAFGLSQVCRQIYHEVGTLAYSDSIFFFCDWDDEGALIEAWTRTLTSAHRNAITDIAIDDSNFESYLSCSMTWAIKIHSVFGGLQRLHLNTHRVNTVYVKEYQLHMEDLVNRERKCLEKEKQEEFNKRELKAVELVWHDDPIEEYDMWDTTDNEEMPSASPSPEPE